MRCSNQTNGPLEQSGKLYFGSNQITKFDELLRFWFGSVHDRRMSRLEVPRLAAACRHLCILAQDDGVKYASVLLRIYLRIGRLNQDIRRINLRRMEPSPPVELLSAISDQEKRPEANISELEALAEPSTGGKPMSSTQYATNMARAFMAAEMVMAAANCGVSTDARARAEKLLDDYFALVEQAVPSIELNPLDRRS
jgi:hypothetical protein